MASKTRAPWWAHVMIYAGALTLIVSGTAAGVTQYGINAVNSAAETEDMLGDQRAEIDADNIEGPLNFLVLGTDKEDGGAVRSDTMIMVHINADLTDVTLISIPRDLKVDIPDCGSGWSNNPCNNKINHAASISDDWTESRANVIDTLYGLNQVQFHGMITANFDGFLELIDMVGEIELCPWHEITSIHGDRKTYPEGCAYYGKEDALDLVRQRKAWGWDEDWSNGRGGDFGRQKMQQQAIKSLLVEAKKQNMHTDPGQAVALLEGFGDSLTLDLGEMKLTDLIIRLRDLDPEAFQNVRVPGTTETIDGTSYVITHEGEEQMAADALWAAVRDDTLDQWILANPTWVNKD